MINAISYPVSREHLRGYRKEAAHGVGVGARPSGKFFITANLLHGSPSPDTVMEFVIGFNGTDSSPSRSSVIFQSLDFSEELVTLLHKFTISYKLYE